MRNSWSDLFVLGLAQISGQVAIPNLLSIIVSHQQSRLARDNTPINVKEVTASICKIHDFVQTLSKLNLTQTEFAYLRAIALFGAGMKKTDTKQYLRLLVIYLSLHFVRECGVSVFANIGLTAEFSVLSHLIRPSFLSPCWL